MCVSIFLREAEGPEDVPTADNEFWNPIRVSVCAKADLREPCRNQTFPRGARGAPGSYEGQKLYLQRSNLKHAKPRT